MAEQLELFPVITVSAKDKTIAEAFADFHEANPHVYRNLVRLARKMKDVGRARVGISLLYENLRWNYSLHTTTEESSYRLPNNYRAYYARLIMATNADLEGMFDVSELRSQRHEMAASR